MVMGLKKYLMPTTIIVLLIALAMVSASYFNLKNQQTLDKAKTQSYQQGYQQGVIDLQKELNLQYQQNGSVNIFLQQDENTWQPVNFMPTQKCQEIINQYSNRR